MLHFVATEHETPRQPKLSVHAQRRTPTLCGLVYAARTELPHELVRLIVGRLDGHGLYALYWTSVECREHAVNEFVVLGGKIRPAGVSSRSNIVASLVRGVELSVVGHALATMRKFRTDDRLLGLLTGLHAAVRDLPVDARRDVVNASCLHLSVESLADKNRDPLQWPGEFPSVEWTELWVASRVAHELPSDDPARRSFLDAQCRWLRVALGVDSLPEHSTPVDIEMGCVEVMTSFPGRDRLPLDRLPDGIGALIFGALFLRRVPHGPLEIPLEIPVSLGYVKVYGDFRLPGNRIVALPESFSNVEVDGLLSLFRNKLPRLPDNMGRARVKGGMNFARNYLEELPGSFGDVTIEGPLYLNNNNLTTLPPGFSTIRVGGDLFLDSNKLECLPCNIGHLMVRGSLWLRENDLVSLPPDFFNVRVDCNIHLDYNPLDDVSITAADFPNVYGHVVL